MLYTVLMNRAKSGCRNMSETKLWAVLPLPQRLTQLHPQTHRTPVKSGEGSAQNKANPPDIRRCLRRLLPFILLSPFLKTQAIETLSFPFSMCVQTLQTTAGSGFWSPPLGKVCILSRSVYLPVTCKACCRSEKHNGWFVFGDRINSWEPPGRRLLRALMLRDLNSPLAGSTNWHTAPKWTVSCLDSP